MKIIIAIIIMSLGICSVIAAPKTQTTDDKSPSTSKDSTGPGV